MAVNKNFVIKNGLEVRDNLILADAVNTTVGIGTSLPSYTLDVAGGIGVTNVYAVGFSTFLSDTRIGASGTTLTAIGTSVGIGTDAPAYTLDVHGGARITGDLAVTGDITYDEVVGRNLRITGLSTFVGISTFESDVYIGGNLNINDWQFSAVNSYVTGVSTFVGFSTFNNDAYVAGVITATSYYGDGSNLTLGSNAGVSLGLAIALGG